MPTIKEIGAPYPEPDSETLRHVINLQPYGHNGFEDEHLQVQIIVGRYIGGDDGDKYVLSGGIEEKTLEGWGYKYWVTQVGDPVATRSSPLAQFKDNFIPLHATPVTRYNSKLPIVVYTPLDTEVHYRIWADEQGRMAQEQGGHSASNHRAALHATATPADAQYREDWEQKYPTEENPNTLGGDDQYPTEEASDAREAAAAQQAQEEEEAEAEEHRRQAEREAAREAEEEAEREAERKRQEAADQHRELAPAHEQQQQLRATEHEEARQQRETDPRHAASAQEQTYPEQVQTTSGTAAKDAQPEGAKKKSKNRTRDLESDQVNNRKSKRQSNSGVMALSSTEESPTKVRSGRAGASTSSQHRSASQLSDANDSATAGNRESTSKSKKRTSNPSPRKSRNLNSDKYKEL